MLERSLATGGARQIGLQGRQRRGVKKQGAFRVGLAEKSPNEVGLSLTMLSRVVRAT